MVPLPPEVRDEIATDRATVLDRIRTRRGSHPDDHVLTDEPAARHFDHFEPPTADEGRLTVVGTPAD